MREEYEAQPKVKEMREEYGAIRTWEAQAARRADVEERLRANPKLSKERLNDEQLKERARRALEQPLFPGQSDSPTLLEAVQDGMIALYFGITMQALADEDLRWMSHDPNPSLRWWEDERIITEKQARGTLGIVSRVLDFHPVRSYVSGMEKACQNAIHGLGLGHRLHRQAGAGGAGSSKLEFQMTDLFATIVFLKEGQKPVSGVRTNFIITQTGHKLKVMH